MANKKGAVGPGLLDITLEWDFAFWDVRVDEASFGERQINRGGYENSKKKSAVSLDGESEIVEVRFSRVKIKKKLVPPQGIGAILADHKGKTVTLKMKPPADHDSGGPADPNSVNPKASAKWNKYFEIQMRELRFKGLELDEDGYLKVDGGKFDNNGKVNTIAGVKFDLYACFVDSAEAQNGLAAHGYVSHPGR